jgi:hypothetical protein
VAAVVALGGCATPSASHPLLEQSFLRQSWSSIIRAAY